MRFLLSFQCRGWTIVRETHRIGLILLSALIAAYAIILAIDELASAHYIEHWKEQKKFFTWLGVVRGLTALLSVLNLGIFMWIASTWKFIYYYMKRHSETL